MFELTTRGSPGAICRELGVPAGRPAGGPVGAIIPAEQTGCSLNQAWFSSILPDPGFGTLLSLGRKAPSFVFRLVQSRASTGISERGTLCVSAEPQPSCEARLTSAIGVRLQGEGDGGYRPSNSLGERMCGKPKGKMKIKGVQLALAYCLF